MNSARPQYSSLRFRALKTIQFHDRARESALSLAFCSVVAPSASWALVGLVYQLRNAVATSSIKNSLRATAPACATRCVKLVSVRFHYLAGKTRHQTQLRGTASRTRGNGFSGRVWRASRSALRGRYRGDPASERDQRNSDNRSWRSTESARVIRKSGFIGPR